MWVQSKVSEATESNDHKIFFDELDFTKFKYFASSNESVTKWMSNPQAREYICKVYIYIKD